jgi:hypothetical protein
MSDIKKGKKKRFSHIFTPSSAHVKGKEQKKNNKLTNLIVFHINDDSNSLLPSSNH